jgi:lysophospholipase L1-like esterase
MRYSQGMKPKRTIFALVTVLVLVGCHSSGKSGDGGAGSGGGGSGGGGSMKGPLLPAGTTIGTYIVLGDSISDGGGTGPFFYDLLNTDLQAKFPGLTYVHAGKAGSITDVFSDGQPANAPLLKDQITGLGSNYPGNVLVTITIGGNDLNGHAVAAITGSDAGIRTEYSTHLTNELGTLYTPGRLGSGNVYVILANIYDFTDGQGDFKDVNCGPAVNITPQTVMGVFDGWNMLNQAAVDKMGALYDMHGDFLGHGYNNTNPSQVWYDHNSCVHPNTAGHDAIRRGMYKVLTGQSLP